MIEANGQASQQPLVKFSLYLSSRNELLLSFSTEILEKLDASDGALDCETRTRASDLMWLWTLGAYEVLRTLCQARRCFEERFFREAEALKLELEKVRVPNTKLERVNYDRKARAIPVTSDRAPDSWDNANKDLLVGDPANPSSARRLLTSYQAVMRSLQPEDVKMSHEGSLMAR